jgi:beta-mannosidase
MFSCSLYPSERWFLDEVRDEIAAQVRRLVSHPSLAIWCGNNENIGALGWFEESIANPGRYLIDFDRLNHGVIAEEIGRVDDTRVFWPSSPAAGDGDFSDNWHDDSSGDMHYWSVWHEGKAFDAYQEVTPRFCSEFGFQAFPSLATLRSFAEPDQLNPTSPVIEHHQRHPRGNSVILETISRYFRFPFDLSDFVYLSQVQQAIAIGTAITFWRSRRPVSMGVLYWQLNDVWPVVSWSSIEYGGRWKQLHYEVRRAFAPRRLALFLHEGAVELHAINDGDAPITGEVHLRAYDWSGNVVWNRSFSLAADADSAVEVWRSPLSELPFDRTDAFLVASSESQIPLQRDHTLLTEYKRVPLGRPSLRVESDGKAFTITCERAPAFFVTPESEDDAVQPDDAGFLMLVGESRRIHLNQIRDMKPNRNAPAPRVKSLRDTYDKETR